MDEKEYKFSCCYDLEIDGVVGKFIDTDEYWYEEGGTLEFYLKRNGRPVYFYVKYKRQLDYGIDFVWNFLKKGTYMNIFCVNRNSGRVAAINLKDFSRTMYERAKIKIANNVLMLYSSAASNNPVIYKNELWDRKLDENEYYEIPRFKFKLYRRGKKYRMVKKYKLGG